ncbi:MAG: O-acetyl-ADP-ribose deacetylase [Salinivirgaceae bacterium]|nr:O-acetyl-ADP-ribose deacetylase [Salinivirgaceae bacterium]
MSVKERIELIEGDITKLDVDAIVNAANSSLLGGGGVDGAIHYAAGPQLVEECAKLGGCPTGEARLTKGYRLPARHVIHTVGPIWRGGSNGEPEKLANCYRNSMQIAADNGFATIAFPAISTGVYGYPLQEAAQIAINQVIECLNEMPSIKKVIFVLFGRKNFDIYTDILSNLK